MLDIDQNPQFLFVKSETSLITKDPSSNKRVGLVAQNIEAEENLGATSVGSGDNEKGARIRVRVLEKAEESGGRRRRRD